MSTGKNIDLNNLNNLLGQTLQGTVVLDANENNKQNNQIYNTKPKKNEISNIPKEKTNNAKYRNSDAYKLSSNYKNQFHINPDNKNPNNLYIKIRNANSIIRNGKLIYNIDINNDSQGLIKEEYNQNNIINKNRIINKNHATINNNQTNEKKENYYYARKSVEIKNSNLNLYQNMNADQNPNNNQINQKLLNSRASLPEKVNKKSEVKDIKNTNIIPAKSVAKNNTIFETQNLNSNIIPQETIQTIYQVKESYKNPYPSIIPNQTIQSIYQVKESNNQAIKKENLLDQIATGQTITSIYKTNKIENNNLDKKETNPPLSLIMPNETIVSIYKDPNNKLNQSNNPLLAIMPNETVKSIYQNN